MKASSGDVDFKYDHSVYWPALEKMTEERRQQRKARWEKAGKLIGESEVFLWGGAEGSVGVTLSNNKEQPAVSDTKEQPGGEQQVQTDTALANNMAKLEVKDGETVQTTS